MLNKKMKNEGIPFVSIIVLNYNHRNYLEKCLSIIEKLNYPKEMYEVILADNCSNDDSVKFIKENFPWVRIIRFEKNYGFCKGNNLAVKFAKGKLVAFLNPDVEVDKGWLLKLVVAINSEPDIACVGGKVFFLDKRAIIQNAGHKMSLIGIPYGIGFGEKDKGQFNKTRYTLSASGCAMLIRKDIFKKVGGFDEDYFMYVEEGDLGLRLWLYGYKVKYVPDALAWHELGAWSKRKITPLCIFYYQKNMIATIIKNFEAFNLLKGLILFLGYDIIKLLSFLKQRKVELVKALISGFYYALKELRKNLLKRRVIKKNRKLKDRDLCKFGLLASVEESLKEFLRLNRS
jgi:GT2 family glycosyltransferase